MKLKSILFILKKEHFKVLTYRRDLWLPGHGLLSHHSSVSGSEATTTATATITHYKPQSFQMCLLLKWFCRSKLCRTDHYQDNSSYKPVNDKVNDVCCLSNMMHILNIRCLFEYINGKPDFKSWGFRCDLTELTMLTLLYRLYAHIYVVYDK